MTWSALQGRARLRIESSSPRYEKNIPKSCACPSLHAHRPVGGRACEVRLGRGSFRFRRTAHLTFAHACEARPPARRFPSGAVQPQPFSDLPTSGRRSKPFQKAIHELAVRTNPRSPPAEYPAGVHHPMSLSEQDDPFPCQLRRSNFDLRPLRECM
jgi:hypothetical protein